VARKRERIEGTEVVRRYIWTGDEERVNALQILWNGRSKQDLKMAVCL